MANKKKTDETLLAVEKNHISLGVLRNGYTGSDVDTMKLEIPCIKVRKGTLDYLSYDRNTQTLTAHILKPDMGFEYESVDYLSLSQAARKEIKKYIDDIFTYEVNGKHFIARSTYHKASDSFATFAPKKLEEELFYEDMTPRFQGAEKIDELFYAYVEGTYITKLTDKQFNEYVNKYYD